MEELKEYTKFQLALRNGQDRDEIWIAYKGIIYDVTESTLWRKGETVFNKFNIIGKLI